MKTPAARLSGQSTEIIVDDKGHILPGKPKKMTAFPAPGVSSTIRWPDSQQVQAPNSGGVTMGYKGIQTDYLPSSTITLPTSPGSGERLYK